MPRQDVLNAERGSNAEVPRSGAMAHQLNEAAEERRTAASSTGRSGAEHRERAWTRVGMARHGEAAGDQPRFDRMTSEERQMERYHAGERVMGKEAVKTTGARPAAAHATRPWSDLHSTGLWPATAKENAPTRRRVVVPEGVNTARDANRRAQEQARTSSQSRGHSR